MPDEQRSPFPLSNQNGCRLGDGYMGVGPIAGA
jgi:hypothetical protein